MKVACPETVCGQNPLYRLVKLGCPTEQAHEGVITFFAQANFIGVRTLEIKAA
jgi:hypothetical protein